MAARTRDEKHASTHRRSSKKTTEDLARDELKRGLQGTRHDGYFIRPNDPTFARIARSYARTSSLKRDPVTADALFEWTSQRLHRTAELVEQIVADRRKHVRDLIKLERTIDRTQKETSRILNELIAGATKR